jgi:hypothetical protein
MKKADRVILIPAVLAVTACVLFFAQSGFGGGHGSFDQAIALLGLPGTLIPLPASAWRSDFVAMIMVPAAVNISLWFVAARAWVAARRNRS